jgi:hypothetical protein
MTELNTTRCITTCAWCATRHELATGVTGESVVPGNGDATLCFSCGAVNIFDDRVAGGLRKPDRDEMEMLDHDETVSQVLRAWSAVKQGTAP